MNPPAQHPRRFAVRSIGALIVALSTSASGFLVATAVARVASVEETGRFAVAVAAVALSTAIARSAVTDPLVVNPVGSAALTRIGRASSIGAAGAVVVGIAGLVTHSEYLLVGAITLHGLTIRECVRAVAVARGSCGAAVLVETTWLAVAVVAFVGTAVGSWSGLTAFAVWAGAGAVLGYVSAVRQRFDLLPAWRSTPVPTGRSLSFAADTVMGSGVVQLVTWVSAAAGGLTVAAALRGAGTLAGPVTVCLGAARSVLIPRAVSRLRSQGGLRGLRRDTVLLCLVASPGLVALAAAGALPAPAGEAVLGETWAFVAPILPLTALELLFQLVSAVPESAHRALGMSRRIVQLRAVSALLRLPAMISVIPIGIGAMAAMAAAVTALNAALWWAHLIHARRRDQK